MHPKRHWYLYDDNPILPVALVLRISNSLELVPALTAWQAESTGLADILPKGKSCTAMLTKDR